MDPAFIVVFWFTIGMLLHVVPKLPSASDIKKLALVVTGSFFLSLIPFKNEHTYNLNDHLGMFFIVFIGLTFLEFRNKIIPRINEHVVVFNTVLLTYALMFLIPPNIALQLAILAVFPTAIVIYSVLVRSELPGYQQILLYFWNDIIFLLLFAVQYNSFIALLPSFETAAHLPVLAIISYGMMFATVSLPVIGLLYLVPIPAKHQPIEERLNNIRDYLESVVHHFTEENTTPLKAIMVAVLTWGILLLNRYYGWFTDFNIITFLIIGIPFVVKPMKQEEMPE